MTEGTEKVQRDFEGALLMAALMADPPVDPGAGQVNDWGRLALDVIDRLRATMPETTLLSREVGYAIDDYRRELRDQEVPEALRAYTARMHLQSALHRILRQRLGAAIERIEAHGFDIRGKARAAASDTPTDTPSDTGDAA